MITVKVTYADGNQLITGINATLEEARKYYHSFPRVEECFETGRETVTPCKSVELITA